MKNLTRSSESQGGTANSDTRTGLRKIRTWKSTEMKIRKEDRRGRTTKDVPPTTDVPKKSRTNATEKYSKT